MTEVAERIDQSRYRRLLELAFESVIIVADEKLVSVNAQAGKLLKAVDAEDLIGESVCRFLNPISLDEFRLLVEHAIEGDGEIPLFEEQLTRLDDKYVDIEAVGLVISYQGKPAVQLAIRDITDRKRAEAATSVRDSWFRGLLQAASDAVLIADRNGVIVLINGQAEEMFGYDREELVGMSIEQLVPERLRDIHAKHRLKYSSDPYFRKMSDASDLVGRRKDGSELPIEVKLDPLFTHEGFNIISTIRNATDGKLAERHTMLVERLAALGQMTAVLAHEVSNPLQIIRGYLDMVLDLPIEAAEKEEYLRIVQGQIGRLQTVSSRILDYARPKSEPSQPVNLVDLAEEVLDFAGKQLQERGIEVVTDFQDVSPVMAVPDHIIQVILNLVLNSIESAVDGGTLSVALKSDKETVTLSFTTYGTTIPSEDLSRIFEPFYTTKSGGAGLGLWICRELMVQNAGTLSANNLADNQGAVFTVTFPRPLSNER